MKVRFIFLLLFLCFNSLLAQTVDTIWYNDNWQHSDRAEGVYFRPPPQQEGELYRVRNYYRNGALQMEALSTSADGSVLEGKATWYYPNGQRSKEVTYLNNRREGTQEQFNERGDLVYTATYKRGIFVSGERHDVRDGTKYYDRKRDGKQLRVMYETSMDGVRVEEHIDEVNNKRVKRFYDAAGTLVAECRYKDYLPHEGVLLEYYYQSWRVRNKFVYKDGEIQQDYLYYGNGQAMKTYLEDNPLVALFYDSLGNKIGQIEYAKNAGQLRPYTGTSYGVMNKFGANELYFESQKVYQDGKLEKEILFDEDGNRTIATEYQDGQKTKSVFTDEEGLSYELVYLNGVPYNGVQFERNRKRVYQNGKIEEDIQYYPETNIVFAHMRGDSTVFFDRAGQTIGKLIKRPVSDNRGEVRYGMNTMYRGYSLEGVHIFLNTQGVPALFTTYENNKIVKKIDLVYQGDKMYKSEIIYGENSRVRTLVNYYSNGEKQSEEVFVGLSELSKGTYYNQEGAVIGAYDNLKRQGKRYSFFERSDDVRLIEEFDQGKLLRREKYREIYLGGIGDVDKIILSEKVDYNGEAFYYDNDGQLLAKGTFRNGLPYNGTFREGTEKDEVVSYKNGKKNGLYLKLGYFLDTLIRGNFKDGLKEGVFSYRTDGYHYQDLLFKAGVLEKAISFHRDGSQPDEMIYKDNKPYAGKMLIYQRNKLNSQTYQDGRLTEEVIPSLGLRKVFKYHNTGEVTTTLYHDKTGQLRLEYNTLNGQLIGTVKTLHPISGDGLVAKVANGKLLSGTLFMNVHPHYNSYGGRYIKLQRTDELLIAEVLTDEMESIFTLQERVGPTGKTPFVDEIHIPVINNITPENLYFQD